MPFFYTKIRNYTDLYGYFKKLLNFTYTILNVSFLFAQYALLCFYCLLEFCLLKVNNNLRIFNICWVDWHWKGNGVLSRGFLEYISWNTLHSDCCFSCYLIHAIHVSLRYDLKYRKQEKLFSGLFEPASRRSGQGR